MAKRYTENLIPLMTSYTTPFGKVDYGGDSYLVYDGYNYEPYHLFGTGQFSSASSKGIWVSYEFEKPERIVKYTLSTHSWLYERSPKSWTFDAWDGTQWIVLDTRDNQPQWTNTDKREYEIKNSYYYKKYRINLKNSWGSYIHVKKMEMMGELPNKSFILHDGEYKKCVPLSPEEQEVWSDDKINIVQKMTSNNSANQIAYMTYPDGSNNTRVGFAYNIFDHANNSYFNRTSVDPKGFVSIVFNEIKEIGAYSMFSDSRTSSDPKDFNLEGSNDTTNGADGTWIVVDTKINVSFQKEVWTRFELNKSVSYKAYRLNISRTHSTNGVMISELMFHPPKKLLSPYQPEIKTHWEVVSDTLPSKDLFITDGMDNIAPILDRSITELEPTQMTNKSEILGVGEIGKVFSKTIDLKKYFDIRSIRTEVR